MMPLKSNAKDEKEEKKLSTETLNTQEILSLLSKTSQDLIEMLESFFFDQKKILPCSAFLDGEYGVKDLCVGVPVLIGSKGIEKIIELELSTDEKKQFKKSSESVDELVKKCKKLLV